MSDHANSLRDYAQAIEHCQEALKYAPEDPVALTTLARLYTQVGIIQVSSLLAHTINTFKTLYFFFFFDPLKTKTVIFFCFFMCFLIVYRDFR